MNTTAAARNSAGAVAPALAAVAAAYPDKPVQYIIPFAAGDGHTIVDVNLPHIK